MNLISEVYPPSAAPEATRVIFVYRYLPIDEKNEPLRVLCASVVNTLVYL